MESDENPEMKTWTSIPVGSRLTAHALHVGDRINTTSFEGEALSAVPLAIRIGENGIAVLFRYGVAVLIGLSPEDERGFRDRLEPRIEGRLAQFEEETAAVELTSETEDQVPAGGPIQEAALLFRRQTDQNRHAIAKQNRDPILPDPDCERHGR